MSVFGKTLRHIALATAGFTLGVSQLMAAGISPIPNSQVNGSAQLVNGAIQLTNGSGNETGSAFYKTAVSTAKFSTHFTVQLSNASADGFTFCLQNNSPTALGSPGQGSNLGFADIPHSIAVAFNIYAGGTLEEDSESYAALATVADSLGKTADATTFRKQADKLNNIYNPATGFLEPRYSDGSWRADFNPDLIEANYIDGYIEGWAWHYLWLVPQDEAKLIQLVGGAAMFNERLDGFFNDPTLQFNFEGAYYNAYNEPDLQAPFGEIEWQDSA
jgi:hypothetical protein